MFGIVSRGKQGFTLVQLLLVVLILGALTAIAVPRMIESSKTAKINACGTNVNLINTQIETYFVKSGTLPADFDAAALTALYADPDYFPDGEPVCPFATAYALNVTSKHVDAHSH